MRRRATVGAVLLALLAAPLLMAPTGSPPPPPLVLCSTACSAASMQVGSVAFITKTAATSRNTTTTLTIDGDLQYTSVPAGTYLVEVRAIFVDATTTTQGWAYALGTTSGSNVGQNAEGYTIATSANTFATINGNANPCLTNAPVSAHVSSASAPTTSLGTNEVSESCFATTAAAGSIGVYWTQGSSSANNTTLLAGSWMRLTRLQ